MSLVRCGWDSTTSNSPTSHQLINVYSSQCYVLCCPVLVTTGLTSTHTEGHWCVLTRPQRSVASEMGHYYACDHSTALHVVCLCWNLLYFAVVVYAWAIFAVVICSYIQPAVQSEVCNRSGWHEIFWLQIKSAMFYLFIFLTHLDSSNTANLINLFEGEAVGLSQYARMTN